MMLNSFILKYFNFLLSYLFLEFLVNCFSNLVFEILFKSSTISYIG